VATVTAPYNYDGMLGLGPEDEAVYVCSSCESTFEDDRYLCPTCGTLTLERRSRAVES
jgi:DNA-directed RNA polymerase subunit RPC12/RpoP